MTSEPRSELSQDRKRANQSQYDSAGDGAAIISKRQRIVETDPAIIAQTLAENQLTGINRHGIMVHLQSSILDHAHVLEQISSLADGPLKQALLGALQPQALLSVSEQLILANETVGDIVSALLHHQLRVQPPRAVKGRDDCGSNDTVLRRLQVMLCSEDLERIDGVDPEFLKDMFAEMVLQWMDVRWRTMDDHGIRRQAKRPREEEPGTEPRRKPWHTRQFVNALVHGGNLGHDSAFVALDVTSTRYGHGRHSVRSRSSSSSSSRATSDSKGVFDSFKLMYSLEVDQGLWLAQKAWLQKKMEDKEGVGAGEFIKTVRLINRYVSWYGNPLYMGSRGKKRLNITNSEYVEKAWIEFIEVVGPICLARQARLSENMARDLRAKSRALVSECQLLEGWARGEMLPKWEVAQVEHLGEAMDVGEFE